MNTMPGPLTRIHERLAQLGRVSLLLSAACICLLLPRTALAVQPPSALVIQAASDTAIAGEYLPIRVSSVDVSGDPSPVSAAQVIDLFSDNSSGSYYRFVGGPAVSSASIAADSSGVDLLYRATHVTSLPVGLTVVDGSTSSPDLGYDQASITLIPAAVDSQQSSVSSTSPVVADGSAFSSVTLVLRDSFGNTIAGVDSARISAALSASAFTVEKPSAASAAEGSFPLRVRTLLAGSWSLDAAVDGTTLSDHPVIEFTPRAIDSTQSSLSGGPGAVADGVDAIQVDLVLRDGGGLAVSGVDSSAIVFTVLGDGLSVEKLAASSALDGSFTTLLRTTVASSRRLAVTVGGVALSDTLDIDFRAGPVDPDHSSAVVSGPALADGTDFTTLQTTLRDAFDNAVAGVDSAQIVISASAVAVEKLSGSSATDGTFAARLRSTTAGTRPVSVTAGGAALSAQPLAVFTASAVDSSATSLSANASAVADGVDTIDLLLGLKDAFGNPVAGIDSSRIGFTLSAAWQLDKLDASSDALGEFHARLRSTAAGAGTAQASLDGLLVGPQRNLEFVPGPLDHFTVNLPAGNVGTAGAALAIQVDALDVSGNRVSGYGGTMHLSSTSIGDGSNLSWASNGAGSLSLLPSGEADYVFAPADSGRVELQLTNTLAEDLSVTLSDGSASAEVDLEFLAAPASVLQEISGDGQSATVGTALALALRTRVLDAFGNPVSGASVQFLPTDGGRVDTDPLAPGDQSAALSDSLGYASCDLWELGTVAGPQSLSAETSFASPLNFNAVATAGQTVSLVLQPNGARDLVVGGSELVAALATDTYGNPVAGVEVTVFSSDLLDGVLSGVGETDSLGLASQRGLTDVDGQIHVMYHAPSAAGRQDVLDASSSQVPSAAVQDLVYTSVVGSASAIELALPTGGIEAGVEGSFGLALVDSFSNTSFTNSATVIVHADPSTGLAFSAQSGGPYLDTLNLPVNGQATVYYQGSVAGTHALTADDSAAFLDGDSGSLQILANSMVADYQLAYPAIVTAGTPFSLSATAYDAFGNVASAALDSFSFDLVDGADTTTVVSLPLMVSEGQLTRGTFSTSLQRIDTSGSYRIRLSADGKGYVGPPLTVGPASAYELASTSADTLSGVTSGSSVNLGVQVLDAFGNAVGNEALNVLSLEGGVIQVGPTVSDGNGQATFTVLTDSTVQTLRLRVGILDGNPVGRETVLFVVQTVAGPIASLSVFPSQTNVTAGQNLPLAITALDAAGNQVLAAADSIMLSSTGSGVVLTPDEGALNAGLLSASARDTLVEQFSITASLKSQPSINAQSPLISVASGTAFQLRAVGDTLQSAPAGTTVSLLARVVDAYGNAVSGVPVHLSLLASPAGASLEDPTAPPDDGLASTDSNGELSFDLHLSATSGDHRVRASILDGNPAALETARWTVQALPGSADHLELAISDTLFTAGDPNTLTIIAKDSAGNVVDLTGQLVFNSTPSGVGVTPSPASLVAGKATVELSALQAGPLTVDVSLASLPAVTGSLNNLLVVPASASGTIPVPLVDPSENTANGLSVTRLSAGPIRDAFGNVVATGTSVDVSATGGGIISDDFDLQRSGVQRASDESGMVDLRLASPLTAGTVTVSFASAAATGSANAIFAAPAALAIDGTLAPAAAVPGQDLNFTISLQNKGGVDAILDAGLSQLRIEDGQGGILSASLLSDTTVPASSSRTLSFGTATLPASFALGSFRPTLQLAGQDIHGQAVTSFIVLPQGSFLVSALVIRSVAHETQAVPGDTLNLRVTVENLGAGPIGISQLALQSSPPADFTLVDQDPLGTVAAGGQNDLSSRVRVGTATPPGTYRFIARVTGTVAGADFTAPPDSSATPLLVSAASQLEFVDGSVSPSRIHYGADLLLKARVKNNGGATVSLNPATSLASFGGGLWSGALTTSLALAPGQEAELSFGPTPVDAALGSRSQDLQLHLEGTENSFAFSADLIGAGAITTETPANLALVPTPLEPASALRGSTVAFKLSLQNQGEAEIVLDPLATRFNFGEPQGTRIGAVLDPLGPSKLTTGSTQLAFSPLSLPSDLALGTPQGYLQVRGTQNGLPFSTDLALPDGTLSLFDPAGLRILSTVALNPSAPLTQVNTGQLIPVRVVVGNNAGEAIDSLTVRLGGSAVPASSAADILIPRLQSSEVDTLYFDTTVTTSPGPESLRVSIVRALSSTTQQEIIPQTPLDDLANLQVQQPVSLSFNAELVDSLDPLTMSVSPGQVISVRFALDENNSLQESGSWLPVQVDFSSLQGFTLDSQSTLPVQLDPSNPQATIQLVAPATAQTAELVAELSRVDLDVNDPDARPLTTASSQTLQVEVFGGVSFNSCGLSILSPQGAQDTVLSTGQTFTLQGEVDGPANLQQRSLELLLPPQLALVGGNARQEMVPGQTTVSWQLLCSSTPVSGLLLRTVAHATDVQSGSVLADTCASSALDIVEAAHAVPRLAILEPNSARDRGELPPGAVVELRGDFALSGSAQVLGPARLHLSVPSGFTILDGQPASVDLADPSDQFVWRVQGPMSLDLGVQKITLTAEQIPVDENSGLAAGESTAESTVALSILADPLRLTISDLSDTGPLIGSDRIYERLAMHLSNGHPEAVHFTQLELTLVDDAGQPFADPSSFLQTIQVRRTDGTGSWSATVGGNPVSIPVDLVIDSDTSAAFRVGAQAKSDAGYVSFRFAVDGGSASILDSGGFELSYALLDVEGGGHSLILAGHSVTAKASSELDAHSYPNPFVPSRQPATLSYSLPESGPVEIEIFDLLGKRVRQWSFANGSPETEPGIHDGDVLWDGRNGLGQEVRNGVYLCRVRAAGREIYFRIAVTR